MPNEYVDFVSDEFFEKCVKHVCDTYNEEFILEDKKLQENGVDPIKMTFDMINEQRDFKKWRIKESERQKDKTVNNAIGEFHQNLLGGVTGWTDLGVGDKTKLDLKKNDNSIFMELKNKDNTVNGDSGRKVREKLMVQHEKTPDAKCYFAYFTPRNGKSEEKHWTPRSKNVPHHENIRRISGSKIYELVTGKSNALEQVWLALPLAIKNIYKKENPLSEEEEKEFYKWFNLAYFKK
jgi:hypothetical protein